MLSHSCEVLGLKCMLSLFPVPLVQDIVLHTYALVVLNYSQKLYLALMKLALMHMKFNI